MESKKLNLKISKLGGIAVLIILVGGTYWTGRSSSADTEDAVRTVSLLFMEELTSRREQVVAKTLSDYINAFRLHKRHEHCARSNGKRRHRKY